MRIDAALAVFSLAAVLDVWSIRWQRAREQGDWLAGARFAALIEGATWLPAAVALSLGSAIYALPAMAGAALGSALAIAHQRHDDGASVADLSARESSPEYRYRHGDTE